MICKEDICRESAWQATLPSLMQNFAVKWKEAANTSITQSQQGPKQLTTEAFCVLCFILFFVMLCLIGSSISAYESFCKALPKKKTSWNVKRQKNSGKEETRVTEDEPSDWRRKFRTFFDCFCIQTNARKILSTATNQEHMDFIDGIRSIIFLWVFIAHFLLFLLQSIRNLDQLLPHILERPIAQISGHAVLGIDIFVVLSGFLTAYLFFDYFEKNNGKISWVSFYAIRFLRITPVYLAVLGFYSTLFTYIGSSPIWPTYNTNPVCKDTWIWNLLYINNFNSQYYQCMNMSWFLACVMQLYVISPFFMIPLSKWRRIGYVLSIVTLCSSCYVSFLISKKHNLFGFVPKKGNTEELQMQSWQLIDVLHQKTYVKVQPYVIGILLGYYLQRRKHSKKSNLLTLSFGWIMFTILIWFSLFAFLNREESVWEAAVYNGVKSVLFSCSFAWLIFICATKQGGPVDKLVSYPIFKPISRLSFCAYLTQTIVFESYFLSVDIFADDFDLSKGLWKLEWISVAARLLVWTLVTSFVTSLLFEYPAIRLLQTYFLGKKKTA